MTTKRNLTASQTLGTKVWQRIPLNFQNVLPFPRCVTSCSIYNRPVEERFAHPLFKVWSNALEIVFCLATEHQARSFDIVSMTSHGRLPNHHLTTAFWSTMGARASNASSDFPAILVASIPCASASSHESLRALPLGSGEAARKCKF